MTPSPVAPWGALLAVGFALSGCTADATGSIRNSQVGLLDASASMRVEVEVYKGPLSKEPAVQVAELLGILTDVTRGLRIQRNRINSIDFPPDCDLTNANLQCSEQGLIRSDIQDLLGTLEKQMGGPSAASLGPGPTPTSAPTPPINLGADAIPQVGSSTRMEDSAFEDNGLVELCGFLDTETLYRRENRDGPKSKSEESSQNTQQPGTQPNQTTPRSEDRIERTNPQSCLLTLSGIAKFGTQLKRRAAFWATENIQATSKDLRIAIANFGQFAAEYGNQITSRSDALIKQARGTYGLAVARDQLPNSVYLRDSAPTSYVNLYYWNDAAGGPSPNVAEANRVRIVEDLVGDNYWSKINTVFAAGQGSVSMALIKDDVGNWNLKSFDNSPGQLLGAYRQAGLAAVQAAVTLAGNPGTGIDRAQNALKFANQVALGSSSGQRAEETGNRLAAMRLETGRRIRETGRAQQQRLTRLETRMAELQAVIDGDETVDGSSAQFDARDTTATDAERQVTEARDGIAATARRIAQERSAIDALRTARTGQAEQLEAAEANLVTIAAESPTTTAERQDRSLRLAAARQRTTDLRAQIQQTDSDIAQRTGQLQELTEAQSTAITGLEQLEADARRARDAADGVAETLADTRAALAVARTQHEGMVEDTARQIEELVSLYRGLLEQMETSVTADAGVGLPATR